MRDIDLITKKAREWLRDWEKQGGDPDAPEAMFWKEKIAQAEQGAADDAADRDSFQESKSSNA